MLHLLTFELTRSFPNTKSTLMALLSEKRRRLRRPRRRPGKASADTTDIQKPKGPRHGVLE